MILILSDSSQRTADIERQLDIYEDRYFNYFTDFMLAGKHGDGSVYVGDGSESSLESVIRECGADALIDCITAPLSKISIAAQSVCRQRGLRYVKYLSITDKPGLKLRLSYAEIADMIKRSCGNVILYASPRTVSAISLCAGKTCAQNMYVPIEKAMTFDTTAALEYSIPLLNVIEREWIDGEDAVTEVINTLDAMLVICDDTVAIEDKAGASFKKGVPVVLTHSMGIEFDNAAATARDAVIAVHHR